MTRIFLTLSVCATLLLAAAFWLGLDIGDARDFSRSTQHRVSVHFLTAVAALVFAILVHAIVLTYFMGTGRWLEETCGVYRLSGVWQQQSRDLKLVTIPAMMASILLLILTGAFGGAADPASAVGFQGWGRFSAAEVHLAVSGLTVVVNLAVNAWEFRCLRRNGLLVNEVMDEVRRIRVDRGLEV